MAKRVSQYEAYEKYIFSSLRKVYGWTKKKSALAKGRVGMNMYQCVKCSGIFNIKEIHADHIIPVMPLTGWDGKWTEYIERMFKGEVQLLCKEHHKEKTKEEAAIRAKNRKLTKEIK